jgi:hypothetical protein
MIRRCFAERRGSANPAWQRLGIVRRDYAPGEREIGEILAIGVELSIG